MPRSTSDGAARLLPPALVLLLALGTLARLIPAWRLELGQDEVYAVAVGLPFQLSFFDHPPLAFWIAGLIEWLSGGNAMPLLLRMPFVAMFTGTCWAMYALTARFYGERAGLWAAGILGATPFFVASAGGWVMPDGPLMLFLVLAALCLARALCAPGREKPRWGDWLLAGLFLGLALLSKYQAFLALFGAFLLLLTPRHRHWLVRPDPYVAALVAALVFAPVIWWNAQNGWVSFGFQLGRGVGGAPSVAGWLRLVLIEALYLLPWGLVGLTWAVIDAAARRRPHAGFLLALALPAILLFNLQPLAGPAGQPHWSMAGWLFVFPLLGRALAAGQERGRKWPLVFAGFSGAVLALLVGATVLFADHYAIFSRLPGIETFARESNPWTGVREALAERSLIDRPGTVLASTDWRNAASFSASLHAGMPMLMFTSDPRGFAFLVDPRAHIGDDAIFAVAPHDAARIEALAAPYFASVETLGTVETRRDGVVAFTHAILLAHRLERPYPLPYPPR